MGKKKIQKPDEKLYYVKYHLHGGSYWHSGEEWGEWRSDHGTVDLEYITSGRGGTLVATHKNIDLEVGKPYILVWLTYSTGDSFGHSTGNPEFIMVFDNLENAYRLKTEIETRYRSMKQDIDKWSFDFDGQTIYCGAWVGYFDSLESVRVDTLIYHGDF